MSSQTFTREKIFTKILVFGLLLLGEFAHAEWEIDLSRRRRQTEKTTETAAPVSAGDQVLNFVEKVIPVQGSSQDVVILNTDKGFLPRTVHLKKNQSYTLHIVNVNEKEKNTSFILDAFKESHGTYFGQIKSFTIRPDKDGIFNFQCPETSIEGRMVIYSDEKKRSLANDDKE